MNNWYLHPKIVIFNGVDFAFQAATFYYQAK